MMKEVYRDVGRVIPSGASLAVTVLTVKYGFDAFHGYYCLPGTNDNNPIIRTFAATANSGVNLIAAISNAPQCPAPFTYQSPAGLVPSKPAANSLVSLPISRHSPAS
jgi:hypothetical protein